MENLNSAEDAIKAISERLRNVYTPYAGAQFRFAFLDDGTTKHFLTAHIIFCERHVPSRPQAEYRQTGQVKFIFVEHWCQEQWEGVKLLSKLLSGGDEIEGHQIKASFSRSYLHRQSHHFRPESWPGWEFRSQRDRDANWKEIYVPQGRLTALGKKSYRGPDEAIDDWIFGLPSSNPVGASVSMKDNILTFLPDYRGRILEANWIEDELELTLEVNIAPEQVELQIRHENSLNDFQVVQVIKGQSAYKVKIPKDADSLSILLLDDLGEPISEQNLDQYNRTFGITAPRSGQRRQGAAILDSLEEISISDLPVLEDDNSSETPGRREQRTFVLGGNSNKSVLTPDLQESTQGVIVTTRLALFISHSSRDKEIAESLTEVIKNSLEINPARIRCTSVEGHRLRGGVDTDDQLRQELLEADCFIGLLTPQSLSSTYVLFELGARWGAKRHLIPLLAAGLHPKNLKGPLANKNGHFCGSAGQVHQLIDELAGVLSVNQRPASSYEKYIERLVNISKKKKGAKPARSRKSFNKKGPASQSQRVLTSTGAAPETHPSQKETSTLAPHPPISLEIIDAKFRANQIDPSHPVGINVHFRLDIQNRGPQTTLYIHDIDLADLSLNENGLHGFFSGGTHRGERILLEPGHSAIVKLSINGTTTKAAYDIPSEISGRIVFKETFTGILPGLSFNARREI